MRLARRLADALRSPARLAAFVRRVGEVALRGELRPMMQRVRPRGPTLAEFRAWRDAQPALVQTWPSQPFIIALDTADDAARAALVEAFTLAPAGASAVVVRGEREGWRRAHGGDTQSLQAFVHASGVSWIWWIAATVALAPDAAAALALGCARQGARVVYADHDVLGEDGKPAYAELKPAWDRVQLFERPYAGPLLALHSSLAAVLDDAGQSGVAGQWRFLLDAAENLPGEAIVHVPRIVAHARAPDRAQCERERDAVAPRIRSLIEANGEHAVMDAKRSPWLGFAIAADCTVSIVIPTRDRYPLLERCLRSILADEFARDAEIVIVDNGSSDPRVPALLRTVGARVRVTVVPMDVPFNFPQLCNAGVEAAGGRIVVLLNNDCEVASTWLVELVGVAARAAIGAVGPLLLYPDGAVQSAGVLLGVNRTATSALAGFAPDDPAVLAWCRSRRQVSAVVGACLAVARDKYRRIGGMDERFAVSHNELDFCLRLEAEGFANAFTPFARVIHQEGGTRGFEVTAAERERLLAEEQLFVARWGKKLDAIDPAHHPALARTGNAFAFATVATPLARAGWR